MQALGELFELLEREQIAGCTEVLPTIGDFTTTMRYHTPDGAQFDCQAVINFTNYQALGQVRLSKNAFVDFSQLIKDVFFNLKGNKFSASYIFTG